MGVAATPLRQDKGPRPQKQQLLFVIIIDVDFEEYGLF
jgi:hypothetical protein